MTALAAQKFLPSHSDLAFLTGMDMGGFRPEPFAPRLPQQVSQILGSDRKSVV